MSLSPSLLPARRGEFFIIRRNKYSAERNLDHEHRKDLSGIRGIQHAHGIICRELESQGYRIKMNGIDAA